MNELPDWLVWLLLRDDCCEPTKRKYKQMSKQNVDLVLTF